MLIYDIIASRQLWFYMYKGGIHMNSSSSIRFHFVGSNSRSILLTDEPSFISTVMQEIDSLIYRNVKVSPNCVSQAYIEKTGAKTYKVNYAGYMKIMSAVGHHMKD